MSNLPPLIIHWHADVITANGQAGLQLLYPGYRIFEKRLLIRATSIIVTSPDYLASSLPLKPFRAKCTVIPLGISPERMTSFQSDRQKTDSELNGHPCTDDGQLRTSALELCQGVDHSFRPSQSAAKNIVFSVGRFTYYKGFEFLLQAAQRIPQASFIIAGSGPKLKSIETLRHKLGLANRVCLPGHLTDEQIHLLLAASNLFCLPSIERTEAFGMVLLEAMHYGKPVISTNVAGSGMQFVNRDGVTGFSVEPSNPEHLAHAILTVLDDSPLQRAMGQQGASRVKSAFHISRIAEDIFTTYHRAGIVDPIERPV
jgi:rhamnosyl/mannosyltransferase